MTDYVDTFNTISAQMTAPGSQFGIMEKEIRGINYKVFENCPPSLREYYQLALTMGYADRDFLVYENERYTFAQTLEEVAKLARVFIEKYEVKKGDRVVLLLRNYPEWIFGFMAATSLGAVVVPMNAWWETEELEYGLRDCGGSVILADDERIRRLTGLIEKLELKIIAVRAASELPRGVSRYEEVTQGMETGALPDIAIDPEDNAIIL